MKGSLAQVWRKVQGCGDWEGLVSPSLHPLLREEIVRYGELVSACYKAFELDSSSSRYLSCKYGKGSMFEEVGMGGSGYDVTRYVYVTAPDIMTSIPSIRPGSCRGRWVGYVAVASDDMTDRLGRRDILVTFRGTVTSQEWVANLMSSLTPARLDPGDPRPEVQVESGFLGLYTSNECGGSRFGLESCREQLLCEISRLLRKYKGEEVSISIAGHSMGSSLAHLLAYDISELGLNVMNNHVNSSRRTTTEHGHHRAPSSTVPVTVFSYGGPRVGNLGFKQRCEELGVKVLRVVNVHDPVTKLPGVFLNENFRVLGNYELPWSCSCYSHVGVEVLLDFLDVKNPSCVHDLDAYISLVRCPREEGIIHEDGVVGNIFERVMSNVVGNFELCRLRRAASGMVDQFLVQSQGAEFLMDNNFLGWMNCLALYMLM
ncbi:unnamed protein product [Linum tenue]|uniref:Fungal lipase-type domain-containing protein n=1 Tax=Linum tenue TaxID=586396 RepID=A0AAV0N0V4_9ROSI|nr:unnamed protein product [Linum tenue]